MPEIVSNPPYESTGALPLTYRFAGHVPLYGVAESAERYGLSDAERLGLGAIDLISHGANLPEAAAGLDIGLGEAAQCLRAIKKHFAVSTVAEATNAALGKQMLPVWKDIRHPATPKNTREVYRNWLRGQHLDRFHNIPYNPPFDCNNMPAFIRTLYAWGVGKPLSADNTRLFPQILLSLPPQPAQWARPLPEHQQNLLLLRLADPTQAEAAQAIPLEKRNERLAMVRLLIRYQAHTITEAATKAIVAGELPVPDVTPREPRLTPLLLHALLGVALGKTDAEIGEVFGISERNASSYILRARAAIAAAAPESTIHNRPSLALTAFQLGIFAVEKHAQEYTVYGPANSSPDMV